MGERQGCDAGRGARGRPGLTGLVSFRSCSAAPVAWASPDPSCSSTSQSTRRSSSSSRKERISPAAASARCVSGDVPCENMCSQAKDPRGQKPIEHAYGVLRPAENGSTEPVSRPLACKTSCIGPSRHNDRPGGKPSTCWEGHEPSGSNKTTRKWLLPSPRAPSREPSSDLAVGANRLWRSSSSKAARRCPGP
jgi:hypothetical protein